MGIDESSHPELCSEVADGVTRTIVCLFREPDAGNLPVRFDEREQETELSQTGLRRRRESFVSSHRETKATAPVLDSTPDFTHNLANALPLTAMPNGSKLGSHGRHKGVLGWRRNRARYSTGRLLSTLLRRKGLGSDPRDGSISVRQLLAGS